MVERGSSQKDNIASLCENDLTLSLVHKNSFINPASEDPVPVPPNPFKRTELGKGETGVEVFPIPQN